MDNNMDFSLGMADDSDLGAAMVVSLMEMGLSVLRSILDTGKCIQYRWAQAIQHLILAFLEMEKAGC
eukprot:scaffold7934_cov59-Attheya_sp.AAC.5